MADYDRLNFREDWTEKVSQYLEEHPEEGFEDDQVKEFIKFVVNKYMSGAIGHSEEEILEKLEEMVDED
jgi:hypothetical protein